VLDFDDSSLQTIVSVSLPLPPAVKGPPDPNQREGKDHLTLQLISRQVFFHVAYLHSVWLGLKLLTLD